MNQEEEAGVAIVEGEEIEGVVVAAEEEEEEVEDEVGLVVVEIPMKVVQTLHWIMKNFLLLANKLSVDTHLFLKDLNAAH